MPFLLHIPLCFGEYCIYRREYALVFFAFIYKGSFGKRFSALSFLCTKIVLSETNKRHIIEHEKETNTSIGGMFRSRGDSLYTVADFRRSRPDGGIDGFPAARGNRKAVEYRYLRGRKGFSDGFFEPRLCRVRKET